MRSLLKYFLALILFVSHLAVADVKVIHVIDGDTVKIKASFLPPELGQTLNLRILGVDTPEKGFRAKCNKEREMGHRATQFTREFVSQGKPIVRLVKWDKYGGRVLGDITVNGKSLKDSLLLNKLAKPYNGVKKEGWCN